MHVCACANVYVSTPEWQSEDTLWYCDRAEDVHTALCCHTWVSRMKCKLGRIRGRSLYLLSYLTTPSALGLALGLALGPIRFIWMWTFPFVVL